MLGLALIPARFVAAVFRSQAAALSEHPPTDSAQAWLRLAVAMILSTIGGVGLWSVVVALPAIQADFGIDRADASLPYTLAMVGFAAGGVLAGRLADRHGIALPMTIGTLALGFGYVGVGLSANLWQVALAHGFLGFGSSVTFAPLIADVSHWFMRRRGIAVSLTAAGNYFAGTFWPPVVQHSIAGYGWRATHIGIGAFCLATMLPLVLLLRQRLAAHYSDAARAAAAQRRADVPFSPLALQLVLCVAALSCCMAMAMPQVHLVAYCGDLGYGVARGAEMLSLMLACGIVSRVASGFIADRIGGVATLLIGSVLQGSALCMYLMFDSMVSLYVISALFGLFQGGIVSSYAIIVREYFAPKEAGTRVGLVMMASLSGMALGGWASGAIFDVTGSYQAAFLNGIGWNLLNVSIMTFLLLRTGARPALAT
jgi:MFS family permease